MFGFVFLVIGLWVLTRSIKVSLKSENSIPEDVKNGQLLFDFIDYNDNYRKRFIINRILFILKMIFGVVLFLSGLSIIVSYF